MKEDGVVLEFASPELRADKEVVLAAIEQDRYAWCHADKELKRAIDRHPDVRAARAQTPEEATALLKRLSGSPSAVGVGLTHIPFSAALCRCLPHSQT